MGCIGRSSEATSDEREGNMTDKSPEDLAMEAAEAAFAAAMPPPGPKFAARLGDQHICPMVDGVKPHVGGPIAMGCPTVLIGGMAAARSGDMVTCVGPPDAIAMGSATVLIGGMPAARFMDQTVHGGMITLFCPTVIIGDAGAGSPSSSGPGGAPAPGSAPAPGASPSPGEEPEEEDDLCRGKPFRQQEQPMSCAQATTSMIIQDQTGQRVSEQTLRNESAGRGHPPGYDPINGTMDADIPTMLNDHGVANNGLHANPSIQDIQDATAGGNPVMLGVNGPGHWVICDGVRTNPDGSQTLLLRDPGGPGGCREMDVGGDEWNNRMGAGAVMVSFP